MILKKENPVKAFVDVLPEKPGVYQFFDKDGKIIYVGKAKNLKKRVTSYFVKNHENTKTTILVRKIVEIRHIVVDTETDALLLENNLIKKYQPYYNVLLKDDKTYPWICIKNEPFPRVFLTRNVVRDGSSYFGPYTSVVMVRVLLDMIKQIYHLRNCSLNLSDTNIEKNKFKVCLEFHIGNCKAPCVGLQAKEDYDYNIGLIRNILKGNTSSVLKRMNEKMLAFAGEYKFEEAQLLKQKIQLLETYQSKSTVVNPLINNVDVFSMADDEKTAYVNFMKVMNGSIIQSHTVELRKRLDEEKESILAMAITEIRHRFSSVANEIIVPFKPEMTLDGVKYLVPTKGDKKKLLELSERNGMYYRQERINQQLRIVYKKPEDRIMELMKKELLLSEFPAHIECFDNSNLQGTNPVAACVVFKNTKPSKSDYRMFNIKTVEGPNDFASMEEIVYRRYSRLVAENKPLPQLIVIDGGKGQLHAAVNSLEKLNLMNKIKLIGIAKRLEEIYFPGDPVPIYLDKTSETLKVIQHIRDEAHRFGITFHRNKRSKSFLKSELDDIQGIGEKTRQKLLSDFKSVSRLRQAKPDEIVKSIGKAKAQIVIDYFFNEPEKFN